MSLSVFTFITAPSVMIIRRDSGYQGAKQRMDHQPGYVSRRTFVAANAVLLAAVGFRHVRPGKRAATPAELTAEDSATASGTTDLALYRPVSVSSTNYGPTPASFAVDR